LSNETLQQQAAQANEYWSCSKTGIEMAVIPAGRFYFGNYCGIPLELGEFSLARHPVTNAQWHDFVRDSQYVPDESHPRPETYLKHWTKEREPRKSTLHHPVTWISFIDALHYVQWAGLAIPSEWCWEKAARGSEGCVFPWGDSLSPWNLLRSKIAHIGQAKTAAVDAYSTTRTAFGCEQMIGNVSEFCLSVEDLDQQQLSSAKGLCLPTPTPDSVPEQTLIALRGSCYLRTEPSRMYASYRRRLSAGRRNSWTGLRVAWFR